MDLRCREVQKRSGVVRQRGPGARWAGPHSPQSRGRQADRRHAGMQGIYSTYPFGACAPGARRGPAAGGYGGNCPGDLGSGLAAGLMASQYVLIYGVRAGGGGRGHEDENPARTASYYFTCGVCVEITSVRLTPQHARRTRTATRMMQAEYEILPSFPFTR